MMNCKLRFFSSVLIWILILPPLFAQRRLVACGDNRVMILDPRKSADGIPHITWNWTPDDAGATLPNEYRSRLRSLDECKPVNGGKQILVTSSSSATLLVDVKTKQVLFYAYTPMAHSAEMLPQNRVVVANSTHPQGNSLEVYNLDQSEQVVFKDSLYSGHGVVWLPKRKLLYALGYDQLRAYSLNDWNSATPSLKLEKSWAIPGVSGHDLSRVSNDQLLVTEHGGVWLFDLNSEQFTPFIPTYPNVKSINRVRKSDRVVYTKAEESWWTFNLYLTRPDQTIHIPDVKLYKVRWF